jgi:hypothetical protein
MVEHCNVNIPAFVERGNVTMFHHTRMTVNVVMSPYYGGTNEGYAL